MRDFRSSSEAALYLWDYFYLSNVPTAAEAKPWRYIENATFRIRESEQIMHHEDYPAAMRVRHAKRVRRAIRKILRCVDELETVPASWTAEVLAFFEVSAERVIEELAEEAARAPLH